MGINIKDNRCNLITMLSVNFRNISIPCKYDKYSCFYLSINNLRYKSVKQKSDINVICKEGIFYFKQLTYY